MYLISSIVRKNKIRIRKSIHICHQSNITIRHKEILNRIPLLNRKMKVVKVSQTLHHLIKRLESFSKNNLPIKIDFHIYLKYIYIYFFLINNFRRDAQKCEVERKKSKKHKKHID